MSEKPHARAIDKDHSSLNIIHEDEETFLFINQYYAECPLQSPYPGRQVISSHVQRNIHRNKRKRSAIFLTSLWKNQLPDQLGKGKLYTNRLQAPPLKSSYGGAHSLAEETLRNEMEHTSEFSLQFYQTKDAQQQTGKCYSSDSNPKPYNQPHVEELCGNGARLFHKPDSQIISLATASGLKQNRYEDQRTKEPAYNTMVQQGATKRLWVSSRKSQVPSRFPPLWSVMQGNSDPFSASAINITTTAHQLLQLSYHWQLFLTYPVWASDLFNDRVSEKQQDYIRDMLGDPAALHCLLASGYYIGSRVGLGNHYALQHKTLAIKLVRQRLATHPIVDVSHAVYHLLALELFCGDYNAAFQHLEALRLIIAADDSGCLNHMLPHLWISDVWLAYHLRRRTLIDIDTWDSPSIARKWEDIYLGACQYEESSSLGALEIYKVDSSLIEVVTAIHKTSILKRSALDLHESQSQEALIQWLHIRAASLDGRLINLLNDQIDISSYKQSNITSLKFLQALNSSIILAAMCYLHLECSTAKYGGGRLLLHTLFEPLLQHLFQLADIYQVSISHDLMIWLLFMCAINSTLIPQAKPSQWSLGALATLQVSLGCGSRENLQQFLQKFLYHEGMEELLVSPSINSFVAYPRQEVVEFIGTKFWAST